MYIKSILIVLLAFIGRFTAKANAVSTKILFLSGGSFNPPTPMHLRMFEIARDAFHHENKNGFEVIGGIISPVHDSYRKPDLVAGMHRCAMVKIAVQSSDWIRLSDWECNEQTKWTRTRISLQYHQNYINSILNENSTTNIRTNGTATTLPNWIPPNIHKYKGCKVQVKLLCGADFLESFARPGLWSDDDVEAILRDHGIVVITRSGSNNPEQFIFQSDLLSKYRRKIDIITNRVPNEISSTLIRRHLRRGRSVKYLLDDCVMDYIRKHRLYGQAAVANSSNTSTTTVKDGTMDNSKSTQCIISAVYLHESEAAPKLGLIKAKAIGAKVLGAKAIGAKVLGAKLIGAKVLGAKLIGAKVIGAKVIAAKAKLALAAKAKLALAAKAKLIAGAVVAKGVVKAKAVKAIAAAKAIKVVAAGALGAKAIKALKVAKIVKTVGILKKKALFLG